MIELKIFKDRVLNAALSCPQADAVLKKLFPEAFREDFSDLHMKKFYWNLQGNPDKSKTCVVLTGPKRESLFKFFFSSQNISTYPIINLDSNGIVNGYTDRESFLSYWKSLD